MYTNNTMIKAVIGVSFWLLLADFSYANRTNIGVNYGQLGDNLPSVSDSIELIMSMKAGLVKLYNANPETLNMLAGRDIRVSIMIPNDQISHIASSQSVADEWVRENILTHYPQTKIRFVLVGNEIFSVNDQQMWLDLEPAMRKIKNSISAQNIHNIKVGTPLAMDIMETSFPPSSGKFRFDLSTLVIPPLLKFLNGTNSFFFLDVYTYFPWSAEPANIDLDYALLRTVNETQMYTDPESGLVYTNLLDQMIDSVIFAMRKLGYDNIKMAIAETGWPNGGDIDQPGANAYNAAIYNRNVVKKMTSNPPLGTPARPGVVIPTFLFSLFNENRKPGPATERHWGLLNPDGTHIYEVDLTGALEDSEYPPMPKPLNNNPFKGRVWCVVGSNQRLTELAPAIDFACNQGNNTCDELAPGRACYEPLTITSHASYAFSSYWSKFRSSGATCYFNGLAAQTTIDPSYGNCSFPSVTF